MKAILVIDDMPQNCQKCFACINIQNYMAMCVACGEKLKISELDLRPSYCPLKPMPEKKNEKDVEKIYSINDRSWTNGFSDGYNYCIDEILGEE